MFSRHRGGESPLHQRTSDGDVEATGPGAVPKGKSVNLHSAGKDELWDALRAFDIDGDGNLDAQELRQAAEYLKSYRNGSSGGGFSLSTFPEHMQGALKALDVDGTGDISASELAAAASALRNLRDDKRKLLRLLLVVTGCMLIMIFAVLGMSIWSYQLMAETEVSGDDATMTVKGTHTPVRVDMHSVSMENGALREREDGALVASDLPRSYATLLDLLNMPLEVIDAVEDLTFMTADGAVHSYPKQGAMMRQSGNGTVLELYTAIPGAMVRVSADRAYFVAPSPLDAAEGGAQVEMRIVLPEAETFSARRALLADVSPDLHLRCHPVTGACLHTLQELHHLHSASAARRRGLATTGADGTAYSYATVIMDSYAIGSSTGSVSFAVAGDASDGTSAASPGEAEEEPTAELEYDSFGCLVEAGFKTVAFPLTVKHCYKWRYTASCEYDLDGSANQPGYSFTQRGNEADFLDEDFDMDCSASIAPQGETTYSYGYCECGGGLKIRAGLCNEEEDYGPEGFYTCASVCHEYAAQNSMTAYDLYGDHGERAVFDLSLTDALTSTFFDVDETITGGYNAFVQDKVYLSMRLAYRRETPAYFGSEDWPAWLDWDAHVAGHYTPDGVAIDGEEWLDSSGKERHARISGESLTPMTLETHGPEEDTLVVAGSTRASVDFGVELLPPALYKLHANSNFAQCSTASGCHDLTELVRDALDVEVDFERWIAEGAPMEHATSDELWTAECQRQVIGHAQCGEFFDVFAADFPRLNRAWESALGAIYAGIYNDPPFLAEGNAYAKCADLGEECTCGGVVRFMDAATGASNLVDDYFRFSSDDVAPESEGVVGATMWTAHAPSYGTLAHYYRVDSSVSCSADALIPAALQAAYAENVQLPGYDVSNWNCYCMSYGAILSAAVDELGAEGAWTSLLTEDWSSWAPFASSNGALESPRTVQQIAGIDELENPLYGEMHAGMGGGDGSIQLSCRCVADQSASTGAWAEVQGGVGSLNSTSVGSICKAAGMHGQVPESAAENTNAFAATGPGTLLGISYSSALGAWTDDYTGGPLLWDNWNPDVSPMHVNPDGYACNGGYSLCFREGSASKPFFDAVAECSADEARVCSRADFQQLCADGLRPSGEQWFGNSGGASDGAWSSEWLRGSTNCEDAYLGTVRPASESAAFSCCRAGDVDPTLAATVNCPDGLGARMTGNGEVCASEEKDPDDMVTAVEQCRTAGAHVCTFSEHMQLCVAGGAGPLSSAPGGRGWFGDLSNFESSVPDQAEYAAFATPAGDFRCLDAAAVAASDAGSLWGNKASTEDKRDFRCCSSRLSIFVNVKYTLKTEFTRRTTRSQTKGSIDISCDQQGIQSWGMRGGLCYKAYNEKKSWKNAKDRCARDANAHVCKFWENMALCRGYEVAMYRHSDNGWYGDHAGDDYYKHWNRNNCNSINNDGNRKSRNDDQPRFNCCSRAKPTNRNFLKKPNGFSGCDDEMNVCWTSKKEQKSWAAAAQDCGNNYGGRICTEEDVALACYQNKDIVDSNSWLMDMYKSEHRMEMNRDDCRSDWNIDGTDRRSDRSHYRCCRAPELNVPSGYSVVSATCPSGATSINDGAVCMGPLQTSRKSPHGAHTACAEQGLRVCRVQDYIQLCKDGRWNSPSNHWFGDFMGSSNEWDDRFAFSPENNKFSCNNANGFLDEKTGNKYYRCCGDPVGYTWEANFGSIGQSVEDEQKAESDIFETVVELSARCRDTFYLKNGVCFRDIINRRTAADAQQTCQSLGAALCTHAQLQEVCAAGTNPFARHSQGWLGDLAGRGRLGTWSGGACSSTVDGPSGDGSATLGHQCCALPFFDSVGLPAPVELFEEETDWRCTNTKELCAKEFSRRTFSAASAMCETNEARICTSQDYSLLCGNNIEVRRDGDWLGDIGTDQSDSSSWASHAYTINGASCANSWLESDVAAVTELRPFRCCRGGRFHVTKDTQTLTAGACPIQTRDTYEPPESVQEVQDGDNLEEVRKEDIDIREECTAEVEVTSVTCPDDLSTKATSNGDVCMSPMKTGDDADNMLAAIATCRADGGRVCGVNDYVSVCGTGGQGPFEGATSAAGWFGDHATTTGGDWRGEYATWSSSSCSHPNDNGAALADYNAERERSYRCCSSYESMSQAGVDGTPVEFPSECEEPFVKYGSTCMHEAEPSAVGHESAEAFCAERGGRLCTYAELQDVCSAGRNPYYTSPGWYGDVPNEDMDRWSAWQQSSCGENARDARPRSENLGFRCCGSKPTMLINSENMITATTITLDEGGAWSASHLPHDGRSRVCEYGVLQWPAGPLPNFQAISFGAEFANPVAIVGPATSNLDGIRTPRLRNLRSGSFEIGMAGETPSDSSIAQGLTEAVGWMVCEAGEHQLSSGQRLVAGLATERASSGGRDTVGLEGFATEPTVVAAFQGFADGEFGSVRIRSVAATSFAVHYEKGAGNAVGFIALERGNEPGAWEVGVTPDAVTHREYRRGTQQPYSGTPVVLGSITIDGSHPSTLRLGAQSEMTSADVVFRVEEAPWKDGRHTTERVYYVLLDPSESALFVGSAPVLCAGYETTVQAETLSYDEIITSEAQTSAAVYAITETDPRHDLRDGSYWTLFSVARYDPSEGSSKERILQDAGSSGSTWFDGFDSGNAGVANHFGDYVTEVTNRHPDPGAWVLSTSTAYSYRSNFLERPLTSAQSSLRSLSGVDLRINPVAGGATASDWQMAEMLVLHTPRPLSEAEVEDIERVLFRRHAPLFLRGHYTTDGYSDNEDGSDVTWDDTGMSERHATLTGADFALVAQDEAGFAVGLAPSASAGSVTFAPDTLPSSDAEFTIVTVAKDPDGGAVFSVANDDELNGCLSGASHSSWSISHCEKKGPTLRLQSTTRLTLCEVEVYSRNSIRTYGLDGATNLALLRPTEQSSIESSQGGDRAVNGDPADCAITQDRAASWEVELPANVDVGLVRVLTTARADSNFEVFVNEELVGSVKDDASAGDRVGQFYAGFDEYTFQGPMADAAERYSVWITTPSTGVVGDGFLEICELEVYGEASVFEAGGAENPNVARDRPVFASSIRSGAPKHLVDGDSTTCAVTEAGESGAFRVDLDVGSVAARVVVRGRTLDSDGAPYSCELQMSGIHGTEVWLGTPSDKGSLLSTPLQHACGLEKHVRQSSSDVVESFVEIEIGDDLSVCEVELWYEDSTGVLVTYDLKAMRSFEGSLGRSEGRARSINDGAGACPTGIGKITGPTTVGVVIEPHIVPAKLVVHYDGDAPTKPTTARVSTGLVLGHLAAAQADGQLELVVADGTKDAYAGYVGYARDRTASDAGSSCGTGGTQHRWDPSAEKQLSETTGSTACECRALCEATDGCAVWTYFRNPTHTLYRRCYLSAGSQATSPSERLQIIGGLVSAAADATVRTMTAEFTATSAVAEVAIFDAYLPPSLRGAVLEFMELNYARLLGHADDFPMVVLDGSFVVEGGGVRWLRGVEHTWDSARSEPLADDDRQTFGLNDLAHSISGATSYLATDYLEKPCFTDESSVSRPTHWGFDPVRTTSVDSNGNVRNDDSYGVEIESLALCRRMTSSTSALDGLHESTVCGLESLDDENPTCQPTRLDAYWNSIGISFRWLPGCRAATHYQVVRNRATAIGEDYQHEAEGTDGTDQSAKEHFCNTYIEPGMQLADLDMDALMDVERIVEYCIRALIPVDGGGIVASDWTCVDVHIGWSGKLDVSIDAQVGGQPLPGVLVDAVLCEASDSLDCSDYSARTSWTHQLEDGGTSLVFVAYSSSRALVNYDAEDAADAYGRCEYSSGAKPDFVLLIDGSDGLAWYASAPGCFLQIQGYSFDAGSSEASFTVVASGGVQLDSTDAFLGFAYHFVVQREPSWHYMAAFCRDTCALTGKSTSTQDDVYVQPYVMDVRTSAFCAQHAGRCPSNLPGDVHSEKGAVIFGADRADAVDVLCDPHDASYAYFNEAAGLYECCEGHVPTVWDSCERHFTVCDASAPRGAVVRPTRAFRVRMETAQPYYHEDQESVGEEDIGWLSFSLGDDSSSAPSVVHLVDSERASNVISSDALNASSEDVLVANAWAGPSYRLGSSRADSTGAASFSLEDGSGAATRTRRVHLLPFAASEFPFFDGAGEGRIGTTVHTFELSGRDRSDYDEPVVFVSHRESSHALLLDNTAVVVPVRVVHAEYSSCGAEGILMCAFSTDGLDTQFACEITDGDGYAQLAVPSGQGVQVRNGCPMEQEDFVDECEVSDQSDDSSEPEIKVRREVVPFTEEQASASDERALHLTADEAEAGASITFKEQTSRYATVYLAAGRFGDLGAQNDDNAVFNEDEYLETAFRLSPAVKRKTYFELTHPDKEGCDATRFAESLDGLAHLVPLPRDLTFSLALSIDSGGFNMTDEAGAISVATYMSALPALDVEAADEEPLLSFAYRKPATLTAVLQAGVGSSELDSCTDSSGGLLYGVDVTSSDGGAQELVISFAVREEYSAATAEVEEESVLYDVRGLVHTEDGMAKSKETRHFVSEDLLSESGSDSGSRLTQCDSSTGCSLPRISMCTPDDSCSAAGVELEGTLHQELINVLGSPERLPPYTKQFNYYFEPDADDLPSAAQAEQLTTATVSSNVVLVGNVPLTANQAIKLPEYVPFLILRDPPGTGSSVTWAKGTTVGVDLNVHTTDDVGDTHEVKAFLGGAFDVNFALGTVLAPAGAGGQAWKSYTPFRLEAIGHAGLQTEEHRIKAFNEGDTVSFSAAAEFNTAGLLQGAAGDVFVTPSLAIKTVTELPIVFLNNGTLCEGAAQAEVSTWAAVDGGDVEDQLNEFRAAAATVSDPLSAEHTELRNYAKAAISDKSWNAMTVHTTSDILWTRIPQLQARCREEWNSLLCNFNMQGTETSAIVGSFEKVEDWCHVDVSPDCNVVADVTDPSWSAETREEEKSRAKLRLLASLDGIKGWASTLQLNEDLKDLSQAVPTSSLLASPLLPEKDVGLQAGQSEELSAAEDEYLEDTAELDMGGGEPRFHVLDTNQDDQKDRAERSADDRKEASTVEADASIVAFGGGQSAISYSYASTKSASLTLTFGKSYYAGGFGGVQVGTELLELAKGSEYSFTAGTNTENGREASETRESETSVTLTLEDEEMLDFFDVGIKNDPVYGTPVFETVAGRTMCPHEPYTQNRAEWALRFPTDEALLDDSSSSTVYAKARSLSSPTGSADEDCVSFFLDTWNLTPYDDRLDLILRLKGTAEEDKYSTTNGIFKERDTVGLELSMAGHEEPFTVLAGEKLRIPVSICPTDARVFAAREAVLAANGVLDAQGNAHSGKVYCNLVLSSTMACEEPYDGMEVYKTLRYDAEQMQLCDDYDAVDSRTWPPSTACVDRILPEIFDGTDWGGVQWGAERALHSDVLITCLSFGPVDLCASNPCTSQ